MESIAKGTATGDLDGILDEFVTSVIGLLEAFDLILGAEAARSGGPLPLDFPENNNKMIRCRDEALEAFKADRLNELDPRVANAFCWVPIEGVGRMIRHRNEWRKAIEAIRGAWPRFRNAADAVPGALTRVASASESQQVRDRVARLQGHLTMVELHMPLPNSEEYSDTDPDGYLTQTWALRRMDRAPISDAVRQFIACQRELAILLPPGSTPTGPNQKESNAPVESEREIEIAQLLASNVGGFSQTDIQDRVHEGKGRTGTRDRIKAMLSWLVDGEPLFKKVNGKITITPTGRRWLNQLPIPVNSSKESHHGIGEAHGRPKARKRQPTGN